MKRNKIRRDQSRLIVDIAYCTHVGAHMHMHKVSNSSQPRLFFHRNGNFCHGSQTEHVSVLIGPCIIIECCSIYQEATLAIGPFYSYRCGKPTARCTVIKNDHGSWLPREPDLEIMAFGDMIDQKLEQGFRFRILPPLNPLNEFPIDEYCLLPRHGVNTDDRMRTLHGIFTAETPVCSSEPTHLL